MRARLQRSGSAIRPFAPGVSVSRPCLTGVKVWNTLSMDAVSSQGGGAASGGLLLKKRGFTLIELLVVIAIIAILAAILFPVFSRARMRANTVRCISNLKQLGLAFQMYRDDNAGRMPGVGTEHDVNIPNWCGEIQRWIYPERGSLWPYVKSTGVYVCPQDKRKEALHSSVAPPPGKTRRDWALSYAMNVDLSYAKAEALAMRTPSRMLLLIHEERERMNDGIFYPTWQDIPSKIHYDGTTIVYLDGNAKWKSYDDLKRECDENYWRKDPPL